METPLDVLSRAASAVETTEAHGDLSIHGHNLKVTTLKELPSRIHRQRRSNERREISQALNIEHSKTNNNTHKGSPSSTRCASTQTIITMKEEGSELVGIPSVNPALPPPSYSSRLAHIPISTIPSYLPSEPPCYQRRPTVINKAPSTGKEFDLAQRTAALEDLNKDQRNFNGGFCDVEEHFRRSLGSNYQHTFISSEEAQPPEEPSVEGSVDDHFAKALGDQWNQLKSRVSPPHSSTPPSTPSPAVLTSQVFKHAPFVST